MSAICPVHKTRWPDCGCSIDVFFELELANNLQSQPVVSAEMSPAREWLNEARYNTAEALKEVHNPDARIPKDDDAEFEKWYAKEYSDKGDPDVILHKVGARVGWNAARRNTVSRKVLEDVLQHLARFHLYRKNCSCECCKLMTIAHSELERTRP
jgi:hypothetical protein